MTHLAQRANDAALAYGYKDEELKRNALENENVIKEMSEKADVDKLELERRLQHSFDQCQSVVTKATQAQDQAQQTIGAILQENHLEKGKYD